MNPRTSRIESRRRELTEQRRRFVEATVVRAQCPTSTRPGDMAVVLPDGSIEGFVGGQCAEESVRVAALDVIEQGEATLLRILPGDGDTFPDAPGAKTVVNPCLSGGAIEIFLEPRLPAPVLAVVGHTPIADALAQQAPALGYDVQVIDPTGGCGVWSAVAEATAVIIASHGRGEDRAIRESLDAGVGFIGLVASRARAKGVLDPLDLSAEQLACIQSPVGLDIGAFTASEIALSILADVVRAVRVDGLEAPVVDEGEDATPQTAIDPVCGMTVAITYDTPRLDHDGESFWFCNPGCHTRYAEELGTKTGQV
jgi:xanthine dehydrogenase accessory factor